MKISKKLRNQRTKEPRNCGSKYQRLLGSHGTMEPKEACHQGMKETRDWEGKEPLNKRRNETTGCKECQGDQADI